MTEIKGEISITPSSNEANRKNLRSIVNSYHGLNGEIIDIRPRDIFPPESVAPRPETVETKIVPIPSPRKLKTEDSAFANSIFSSRSKKKAA